MAGDEIDQSCDGEETCYADLDEDGYGNPADTVFSADTDCADGRESTLAAATDCDDDDTAVHPGASEVVGDEVDQDCDGEELCYTTTDADGDGYADGITTVISADTDCADAGEQITTDVDDCDGSDAAVHPGATERAGDEFDQNCDGFEQCYTGTDADGDGYIDTVDTVVSVDLDCADPGEQTAVDIEDCDGESADIHPGATEICDGIDNDCDGMFDDEDDSLDVSTGTTFYADADQDAFGSPDDTLAACTLPEGYTTDSQDCDDSDAAVYPGADEVVGDEVDQSCDGEEACFVDEDSDGHANEFKTVSSSDTDCTDLGEGTVAALGDCDDANPDIFPGAEEIAGDGLDNDCDGSERPAPSEDTSGCAHAPAPGHHVWLAAAVLGIIGLRRRED